MQALPELGELVDATQTDQPEEIIEEEFDLADILGEAVAVGASGKADLADDVEARLQVPKKHKSFMISIVNNLHNV